jgi:hypothetical protein
MTKKKDVVKKKLVKLSTTLYADKGTYDKVHRHLTDITDTITEEDIRNVSTDIVVKKIHEATSRNDLAMSANGKKHNGNKPEADLSDLEEEKMYEEGEKVTSPWNIMSE